MLACSKTGPLTGLQGPATPRSWESMAIRRLRAAHAKPVEGEWRARSVAFRGDDRPECSHRRHMIINAPCSSYVISSKVLFQRLGFYESAL